MNTRRSFSRRNFALGSAAIAAFALTSRNAGARSTGVRIVNANGLRVRTRPGLGNSVITSLPVGAEVIYLRPAGSADGYEWAHVELGNSSGQTGYVAAMYLSSPSGGEFPIGSTFHVDTAAGSGANLRSSASISASVVRVIPNGWAGTIQGGVTNADGYAWYSVTIGGSAGWMASVVMAPGGSADRPQVRVADGPLNVRQSPSLNGDVITTAPTGATGSVTGQMPAEADGYVWIHVELHNQQGTTGWVAQDFLTWL